MVSSRCLHPRKCLDAGPQRFFLYLWKMGTISGNTLKRVAEALPSGPGLGCLEDPKASFHTVGQKLIWALAKDPHLVGFGGAAGISKSQAAQLPLQPVPSSMWMSSTKARVGAE